MGYIKGDRNQITLMPAAVEDYISKDDPVRAYDAFVEALDFHTLGLRIEENQCGANSYWPKAMLKLLIYGYAYGMRSSRKLERACYHNLAFIWLSENIKPDYRTIARFRIANKEVMKDVLRQCARMCIKLGLIEGNTLFIDGTKIKANASLKNTWTEERIQKYESKIQENIERILDECQAADEVEETEGSWVKLKEELANQEALKAKVAEIAKELKRTDTQKLNPTDPESSISKGDRGVEMYHNGQIVVDEKQGLIVTTDVVQQNVDTNQLAVQTKEAQEVLGKKPKNVCADNGYYSLADIEKIDKDIQILVPSQGQLIKERHPERIKPFLKDTFRYDPERDCYLCVENKELQRTELTIPDRPNAIIYKARGRDCKACTHFGVCTTSRGGRKIIRQKNELLAQRLAKEYASDTGQRIYKLRKQKVELPFAHFKHTMNMRQVLLRGVSKVGIELNLCAIGYNLTRMIGLLGVHGLQEAAVLS